MEQAKPDSKRSPHATRRRQLTGRLAGGVAHDFNNLLATVLGNLELMERRVERIPQPEQDRFRRMIRRSIDAVQRAGDATARLLAFSRRQSEGSALVDVNAMIADLLVLASGSIGRRIQITTNFAPDLPSVPADPVRLEMVLLELLLNAREAMPDGGNLMVATSQEQDASIQVTVSHSGAEADFVEDALLLEDLRARLCLTGASACLLLLTAEV